MEAINSKFVKHLQKMGFVSNFVHGFYTFANKVAGEGFTLRVDNDEFTIQNFAFIEGEQVHGEAASESVVEGIQYLEDVLNMNVQDTQQKLGPYAEVVTQNDQGVKECVDNIDTALSVMQDIITIDAVTAHPGEIQVLLTLQKTDPTYIKTRPGPKKTTVSYVDGTYMTRALNFAFLFDWSFEVPETRQDGEFFTALGLLTVNLDGKTITKSQWGSQKMRAGMELGDALKGATTDALKKCASMFGIAADVYSGEV